MTAVPQEASRLDVSFVRGDAWGLEVDFADDMAEKTFAAGLYSLVTGQLVKALTCTVLSAPERRMNFSLSAAETLALVPGTYEFRVAWSPAERRIYEGFAEVLP